jgi:hypothetical protein
MPIHRTAFARATMSLLGALALPWALQAADTDGKAVCIEARLVAQGPDGKVDVVDLPKMTVAFSGTVTHPFSAEHVFPRTQQGVPVKPRTMAGVRIDSSLQLTPHSLGNGILLEGRLTLVDTLDTIRTHPPNGEPNASSTLQKVITPIALILIPGEEFVAIPMAKRGDDDRKHEIRLRAALTDGPAVPARPPTQITVEAQFIERTPDGQLDLLSAPKVTMLPGKTAILRMVEERAFPTGGLAEILADAKEDGADKVETGAELEVCPTVEGEANVRLVGVGTITDVMDQISTAPPNEGPAASYAIRQVVAPFSLVCPTGEFVTIPMAKRDNSGKEIELRVRAKVIDLRGEPAAPPKRGAKGIDWGAE